MKIIEKKIVVSGVGVILLTRAFISLFCCLILSSTISVKADDALPFDGILPRNAQASFLLRFDQLPEDIIKKGLIFRLNEKGEPVIVADRIVMELRRDKDTEPPASYALPGKEPIDQLTWTPAGHLLMISGPNLGAITDEGFQSLVSLPYTGMKLEIGAKGRCYVYGGDKKPAERLYIYEGESRLRQLFRAASPIAAVAGCGDLVCVAAGKLIYLLIPDKPARIIYKATDDIVSLEIALPHSIFFSTKSNIGFIDRPGESYIFLIGKGGDLMAHEEDLYIVFKDTGIMRISPVSSFAALADRFMGRAERKSSSATSSQQPPRTPL